MNHYGYENFEITLVEKCATLEQLNEREEYWIAQFDCLTPRGYNMTLGGDGGNTLLKWSEEDKRRLWENQAKTRTGKKKSDAAKKRMSESAKFRESTRSESDRKEISNKISKTLKRKYESGELVATTPNLKGKEHPKYLQVDVDLVLKLIYECKTLKEISEIVGISKHGIRSRLIENTGKNYLEWRSEYGIVGPLSKPRRTS
jgi:group I intron endonuclease